MLVFRILSIVLPLIIYFTFFFIAGPVLISEKGWHLLGIFIATICAIIMQPIPTGTIAIISLTVTIASNTVPTKMALQGFSSSIIWLIFLVYFLAQGIINVGLSKRMSYLFIKIFGTGPIGLAYSIILTDVLISPFIPSSTAKAGGIVVPILNDMGKFPITQNNPQSLWMSRKLHDFLSQLYAQTTCITGTLFLTGTSINPIIYGIGLQQGINVSWFQWFLAASIPAVLSLICLPWIVLHYFPVPLINSLDLKKIAKIKLHHLGKITLREACMLFILATMLFLWMHPLILKIDNVTTALIGISTLLLTKIITLDEILSGKSAWNTFLWFSIITMLSQHLQSFGIIEYFSTLLSSRFITLPWHVSFPIMILVYFYSHYLFVGAVTQITSTYSIFLALAISLHTPPIFALLTLAFASNLFVSLTHYSSAATTVLFANSNITTTKWCKVGFICSIFYILLWSSVGIVWWKILKII